jgi:alkylhydroperoxidase/carboxymuconolactone decarboxylase family protein YurZ
MANPIDPAEHARGVAMFHKVFGPDFGDELARQLDETAGEVNRVVMTRIGPEIWERDTVDIRTKILCAVAIFAAMGREEVKYFMRAALIHGVTRPEIEDILLLAGLEAGFPNAAIAARRLGEVEAEHAAFVARPRG